MGSTGAPEGRGAAAWRRPPPQSRKPKLKKTDFVSNISKVLRDLRFSRNQPVTSADDQYIRILKNKLIKIKKQEDRTL
jgi:hypothetical protein